MTEVILAKGALWSSDYTQALAYKLGYKKKITDFFRVEHVFTQLAVELGARAEWSVRYEEVTGQPESLQFDIDRLRDQAIAEWVDKFG